VIVGPKDDSPWPWPFPPRPNPPLWPGQSSTSAPVPVSPEDSGEKLGIGLGSAAGAFLLSGILFMGLLMVCMLHSSCPLHRKKIQYQELN